MTIKTFGHGTNVVKLKERVVTIAVGFDGVLHKKPGNERGNEDITGPPVPGAMKFIKQLVPHANVVIFTSRLNCDPAKSVRTLANLQLWFERHLSFEDDTARTIISNLHFTALKPRNAIAIIDDKALTFNGMFPHIQDLLRFKPWTD